MARGLACAKCMRFMRIVKNGIAVEEGMPTGPRGEEVWQSYKLWMADLFECDKCGSRMICGFANQPISEHFMEDYKKLAEKFQPIGRIDDCGGAKP